MEGCGFGFIGMLGRCCAWYIVTQSFLTGMSCHGNRRVLTAYEAILPEDARLDICKWYSVFYSCRTAQTWIFRVCFLKNCREVKYSRREETTTVRSTIDSVALDRQQSRDADMLSSMSCFEDERGKMHRGGRQVFCLNIWKHNSLDTWPASCWTLREPETCAVLVGFCCKYKKGIEWSDEGGSER